MNPLAWVNTTVYDFRSQLKAGSVTLRMWTYAEDFQSDEMIQSLATVVTNTSVDHATALILTFKRFLFTYILIIIIKLDYQPS